MQTQLDTRLYCSGCDRLHEPTIEHDTSKVTAATCPACGADLTDGVTFPAEVLLLCQIKESITRGETKLEAISAA